MTRDHRYTKRYVLHFFKPLTPTLRIGLWREVADTGPGLSIVVTVAAVRSHE
jgi:hypothetical protein